jgi:hypothetical protein
LQLHIFPDKYGHSSDDVKIGQFFKQKVHQKDVCGGGKGNFHGQNLTPRNQPELRQGVFHKGIAGPTRRWFDSHAEGAADPIAVFFPPDGHQADGYFRLRFGQPLR